jgi:hypothetical protein
MNMKINYEDMTAAEVLATYGIATKPPSRIGAFFCRIGRPIGTIALGCVLLPASILNACAAVTLAGIPVILIFGPWSLLFPGVIFYGLAIGMGIEDYRAMKIGGRS